MCARLTIARQAFDFYRKHSSRLNFAQASAFAHLLWTRLLATADAQRQLIDSNENFIRAPFLGTAAKG
jgi:hypothetical protein